MKLQYIYKGQRTAFKWTMITLRNCSLLFNRVGKVRNEDETFCWLFFPTHRIVID